MIGRSLFLLFLKKLNLWIEISFFTHVRKCQFFNYPKTFVLSSLIVWFGFILKSLVQALESLGFVFAEFRPLHH